LERVRRNGREFNFIIDGAATVEIRLACRSEPSGHVLVESGISTDSFDGRTWSGEEITMAFDPEGDLSDVGKTPLHFDVGDQRPPIIGGFDCPGFQLR
jgi:hypothetical protein